ncbi:MAG TPA: RNA 2',3'-cyclic phosphodiesterase [Polyangiaceae bacterium]
MPRLFFAVGISRDVEAALRTLRTDLGRHPGCDRLRFVAPEQAHYTLRFLGEETLERQASARQAGRGAALGLAPFDVTLERLGVFPDHRRAHTLWMGAGRGAAELTLLANRLEGQLVERGFSSEDRPFVPHLTIARVKRRLPAGALAGLLNIAVEAIGPFRVDRFALMESQPTRTGVRYVAVETFSLEFTCTPSS